MKQITALSLVQPWGELVVAGKKNVENRSWNTKKRGFIAIHASKSKDKKRFELCRDFYRHYIDSDDVDFGAVIGFAEIIDVIDEETVTKKTQKWFEESQYGFVLDNIIRLDDPVEIKGHMGFWKLEGKELQQCLSQLPKKQRRLIEENLLA
jgi:hypothetical protein